jgi:hypothetical protein
MENNYFTVPMDGSEIAQHFGVTRQNVSQTLKRAMAKFYKEVGLLHPEMKPFQRALLMMDMFDIGEKEDVNKFFHLFPPKIKNEIKNDVLENKNFRGDF